MKTPIKELIKKLNDLSIYQNSYDFLEDIPEEIYKEYFEQIDTVESELSVSKHRWYETSITVFEYEGGFFGVESVTDLFSESMDYSDCSHILKFFEMEAIEITSYKRKK